MGNTGNSRNELRLGRHQGSPYEKRQSKIGELPPRDVLQ